MRIGIVCYPTYGGSGVVATELGMALAKEGYHIHFIAYRKPARLNLHQDNVYFHVVRYAEYPLFEYAPYESALTSKIVEVVLSEKIDLLHVHYAIPHAAAAYMAKQILGEKGYVLPVVTTLHGTDISLVGRDKSYEPVVTFSINQSDRVTAVSESLKKETIEYFNISRKIEVIPNFINPSGKLKNIDFAFRQSFASLQEKILIHVSNFRKLKRVEDVIRVFHLVSKQMPARLLLVGDGPEKTSMESLVDELKLNGKVRFLGNQEIIEKLLLLSDLFLISSEHESFGLAALEAMLCRVPVISSDIGGLKEINIDGKTGFVCPLGDVQTMATKALLILKDDELHQQMSENAYRQAMKFDLKKILPLYESLYTETIQKLQSTH